ncbi:type II secretion system F family protein [Pirellulimonas nuda]|nr:type II secretion system F family protein [Pirellulimonas nuda]
MLAVAAEERIGLVPLLAAAVLDERGVQRQRLRRVVAALEEGGTLPDALEQSPGVLTDEQLLSVRLGAQSGMLAAALRDAIAQQDAVGSPRLALELRRAAYYLGVILVLGLPIAAFIGLKISPELKKISNEFELQTPWATDAAIAFNRAFVQLWWLAPVALLLAACCVVFRRPRRFVGNSLASPFFAPLRRLRAAGVVHRLGLAAETGRPLPGVLSTLARYHYDPAIRHKLLFVRNELELGAPLWPSMQAVNLLAADEVQALDLAERLGNRPWTLMQLAAGKRRRATRLLERMAGWLVPLVVLAAGAFVLLQAYGTFGWLIDLVESLA